MVVALLFSVVVIVVVGVSFNLKLFLHQLGNNIIKFVAF